MESLLDDVPGLGEVRRKSLVKHFGSLRKLRAASAEEIAQVPGIGPATAVAIVEAVARDAAGDTGRAQRGGKVGMRVNTATGEIEED